jgi:hypothetical protein
MFINKECPRCESKLRKTPGLDDGNCFFCTGYTNKEVERREWFVEETRFKGGNKRSIPIEQDPVWLETHDWNIESEAFPPRRPLRFAES